MDKTIKIITTMDYLQTHDLSAFKGATIRILVPESDSTLAITFVNKLFAYQITPEFIPVDPDQLEFTMGYVLGRALQSNGQIILLAKGLKKPEYMAHTNAFVLDDIDQFAAAQKALEKSTENKDVKEPRRGPGRPRKVDTVVASAENSAEISKSVDTDEANNVSDQEAVESMAKAKLAKKDTTQDDIAQCKTMLNKLGAMAVVKKYNISEDEFFAIFMQSVKDAYEYVSYEAQLQVRFQNLDFVKEFYKLTKNSFDKFKKVIDKI